MADGGVSKGCPCPGRGAERPCSGSDVLFPLCRLLGLSTVRVCLSPKAGSFQPLLIQMLFSVLFFLPLLQRL